MKRYVFLSAMLLSLMCGCSQFDGEVSFDPSQVYTVEVTANSSSESSDTRISLSTSDDTWSLKWESGDAVTGWQGTTTLNEFTLTEINSANSQSATFTGEATMGYSRLIYPYNAEATTDESGNYLLDLSTQSADMSSKYSTFADKYMYMASDMFSVEAGGSVSDTPSMSHLLATMELKISVTDIENGDNFVVSSFEIDGLESSASLDFSTAGLTATTSDKKITVTVDNAPGLSSDSELLIPFAAIPFTATAETTFSITLHFTNGGYVTITKSGTEDGVPFAAGTHNYLTVEFSKENVEEYTASTHPYLADYSSTSYPTDTDTWIIYDESASSVSDFDGLQAALGSAYDESREISLIFPNLTEMPSATTYNNGALYNCEAIVSISLPKATIIGDYAFDNCSGLRAVSLPEATSIGIGAFRYCSSLETISLPEATSIGKNVFISCSSLETISLPKVTSIGSCTFYSCSILETISLPEATFIDNYAFQFCLNLETISLPKATSIGDYAFYYCSSLTSLEVATGSEVVLTSLGSNLFYNIISTNITLTIGSSNASLVSDTTMSLKVGSYSYTFKDIIFVDSDGNEIDKDKSSDSLYTFLFDYSSTSYPTDTDMWTIYDETVSSVDYFDGLQSALGSAYDESREISLVFPNLTEVPIASSLYYSSGALYNCKAIVSISLPVATLIGDSAFRSCSSLEIISLPEATSIGDSAFRSCSSLETISLPVATEIGSSAFYSCSSLETISLPKATSIGTSAFNGCSILETISLPEATSIGDYTFRSCSSLETISLPEATSIGSSAFYSCSSLETISLPEATSIGDYTFRSCSSLEIISLPEATSIGSSAFYSCSSLETISLPEVTSIGSTAFRSCSSLTSLELATGSEAVLTSLESNLFYGITGTSTNIDLTVGLANTSLVSDTTLTVGSYSYTFKSITIQE